MPENLKNAAVKAAGRKRRPKPPTQTGSFGGLVNRPKPGGLPSGPVGPPRPRPQDNPAPGPGDTGSKVPPPSAIDPPGTPPFDATPPPAAPPPPPPPVVPGQVNPFFRPEDVVAQAQFWAQWNSTFAALDKGLADMRVQTQYQTQLLGERQREQSSDNDWNAAARGLQRSSIKDGRDGEIAKDFVRDKTLLDSNLTNQAASVADQKNDFNTMTKPAMLSAWDAQAGQNAQAVSDQQYQSYLDQVSAYNIANPNNQITPARNPFKPGAAGPSAAPSNFGTGGVGQAPTGPARPAPLPATPRPAGPVEPGRGVPRPAVPGRPRPTPRSPNPIAGVKPKPGNPMTAAAIRATNRKALR